MLSLSGAEPKFRGLLSCRWASLPPAVRTLETRRYSLRAARYFVLTLCRDLGIGWRNDGRVSLRRYAGRLGPLLDYLVRDG